jgi:hypothetical protein
MLKEIEFKRARFTLILWLFQASTCIGIALVLYLLCDLLKLLPAALSNHSSGPIGIIVGSLYFGYWMEKKYPDFLSAERIKQLSLSCSWINYTLFILIFLLLFCKEHTIYFSDFFLITSILIFTFLITVVLYFFTSFSIQQGMKKFKKKNLDDLPS